MRASKPEVFLHFVWATRYREPSILPLWKRRLYRCIEGQARSMGCDVLAINGMPDHLHVLVKLPTTVSIAAIAKQIKGVSSRFVREELPEAERFYWQSGYGVFSVDPLAVDRVIDYIDHQEQRHGEQRLRSDWESFDEAADEDTPP